MHPVPMALRWTRHAMSPQKILEAHVRQLHMRRKVAHQRRLSECDQVGKRDAADDPSRTSPIRASGFRRGEAANCHTAGSELQITAGHISIP